VSGVTYNPNESCGARFDWATDANRGLIWPDPYIAVETITSGSSYRVYSSTGVASDYTLPSDQSDFEIATLNKKFYVVDIFISFSDQTKTIYDCLRGTDINQQFERDMLSLYLSNIDGGYTALSLVQIEAIYTAFQVSGGSFEVKPGISWTSTQFDEYLAYLRP